MNWHWCDHGEGHGAHISDCWLPDDHGWQANDPNCNHMMVNYRMDDHA